MKKFTLFPVLMTERLVLRQLEEGDAAFIYLLKSSPENNLYLDTSIPKELAETVNFITKIIRGIKEDRHVYWSITLKESGEMIGSICLWNFVKEQSLAEFGYELYHAFHKQGYMREAFGRVMKYAIEDLNLAILEAYTQEDNAPSIGLLEYFDFEEVGRKEEAHSRTGKSLVQVIYRKDERTIPKGGAKSSK